MGAADPTDAGRSDAGIRVAAIGALVAIGQDDAATLGAVAAVRYEPLIRTTAAVALAGSCRPEDVDAAIVALADVASDTRDDAREARRAVAAAVGQRADPRFRRLLLPLLYDPAPEVADAAMDGVHAAATDVIFVPTLIALLRHRRLKSRARAALIRYGEPVVDVLGHFMRDPDEDLWVRRHIPATLAQLPSQKSVDVLVGALDERDGFLRYKAIAALERLRREHPELAVPTIGSKCLRSRKAARTSTICRSTTTCSGTGGSRWILSSRMRSSRRWIAPKTAFTGCSRWCIHGATPPRPAGRWSTVTRAAARTRRSTLDNLLTGRLRKGLMPLLEDVPRDERIRRGNVLLKTRPRDIEETLLQLINDDDQVVAAAAIDVVRQQKLWSLADDVEHVLAHRDVRDWHVFEAASWALAERRVPTDRRRELWLDPLPAAELAGRIQHLPLFASTTVDELFRVARAARQVRHVPGSVLLQQSAVPPTIHLLLEGSVTCEGRKSASRTVDAPAALGFAEVLRGRPMSETVRTKGVAVTLALTAEELQILLEDNADLIAGLFATQADGIEYPDPAVHSTVAAREWLQLAAGGVTPIDKVLALQYVPLFARVLADEMRDLATIAQSVEMTVGSQLYAESAPPALWLILAGEVSLTGSTETAPLTARGGDIMGLLHTLTGGPMGRSADVLRNGVALRIDRDDFFDLLGERSELMRQVFAACVEDDRFTLARWCSAPGSTGSTPM